MKVDVKNIEGNTVKKIDLADHVFNIELKEHLLHSVIKAYLANKRQGTHYTKTKSFVSGGGKKPFKQKGTGNARQGSNRSPLMPGGGVLMGPQPRDYREKTNKQARQLALKMALSDKVRHKKLLVIDDFKISNYSTKHIVKVLDALELSSVLLADERKDDFLFRSSRNIHGVRSISPAELNAEHVLRHEALVISENALHALMQRFEEKTRESV